jgi:hypothetical protein
VTAREGPRSAARADGLLAWERLCDTAARLGITVLDGPAGSRPWPDEGTTAIVSFGEHIALGPGLDDAGPRADVLAMALIVAAVMGDRFTGHPCAITAPAGYVLLSRVRVPRPTGPGELATLLARACGRDVDSAAFEYTAPRERAVAWETWMTRREWRVPPDDRLVLGAGRVAHEARSLAGGAGGARDRSG